MIRLASQYALIETRRDTALDLQRIEQSSRGRVSIVVRDWAEQSGAYVRLATQRATGGFRNKMMARQGSFGYKRHRRTGGVVEIESPYR